MIYFLPLGGLVLPFFSWVVETVLPYPYIVEELGKFALVVLSWNIPGKSAKIKTIGLAGFFFALSENIFYLFNFSVYGSLSAFFLRLFLTSLLHIITSLVILIPTIKNKKLAIISLPLAILIHYLYNSLLLLYFIPKQ